MLRHNEAWDLVSETSRFTSPESLNRWKVFWTPFPAQTLCRPPPPPALGGRGCSLGDTTAGLPSPAPASGVSTLLRPQESSAGHQGPQWLPAWQAIQIRCFWNLGRRALAMRGHSCSLVGPQLSYLSQADASTSPRLHWVATGSPAGRSSGLHAPEAGEPKRPSHSVQPVPAPTFPQGRGRSREAN